MLARATLFLTLDEKGEVDDHPSQIHEHSGGRPGPGAEIPYREAGLQGFHRPGNGPRPALDRTSPGQGGKPATVAHLRAATRTIDRQPPLSSGFCLGYAEIHTDWR